MTIAITRGTLRRSLLCAAGAATVMSLGAPSALAAELVYYQDWQEGDAFNANRWLTTQGCTTYSRDPNAQIPGPQRADPAPPECSGRHLSETLAWSGGRVMSRSPIPVQAGDRMCVTAWIRANGEGQQRAQPFIGVNFVGAANPNGFPDNQGSVGGCHNGEHWLIGNQFDDGGGRNNTCVGNAQTGYGDDQCCGRSTLGYGPITPVLGNGWNFYTKEFTVFGNDITPGPNHPRAAQAPFNRMVLKLQNWSGGGGGSCNGERGAAEFDDIRVYKLAPEDEGCPTMAQVIAAGDDAHETCAGNTPFCQERPVNITVNGQQAAYQQTYCAACTDGYGAGTATSCGIATPGCNVATGACGPCNGDAGTNATNPCGGAFPVCQADGSCGNCADAGQCQDAPGITRAGPNCVAGACTGTCVVGADGRSPECGDNRYCHVGQNGNACLPKLANGAQIPVRAADGAVAGVCRDDADGAPVTASIFCASGLCSKTDNACGLADGDTCAQNQGAAGCRAGRCGADDKCGLTSGAACTSSTQCRGEVDCENGFCGGAPRQCEVDADCGSFNFVCDASGACATGCRGEGGNGCPEGRVCSSTDNSIGRCEEPMSSSSSSGGSSTSSGGSSGEPGEVDGGSSGTSGVSSTSSGGEGPDQPGGEDDGEGGGGGGCSTTNGSSGSVVTLLIGFGLVAGALRRRRQPSRF